MKNLTCLPAVLGALFTFSCATVDRSVDVSLSNIGLSDVTLLETTAVCTIRIQNANASPLRIEGAVYRIDLDGRNLGKGMTSEALAVPAYGTATQKVKIYLQNLSMASRIRRIVESRSFRYEIDAELDATLDGRKKKIAAEDEGRFDLDEFTPSAGPKPAARR